MRRSGERSATGNCKSGHMRCVCSMQNRGLLELKTRSWQHTPFCMHRLSQNRIFPIACRYNYPSSISTASARTWQCCPRPDEWTVSALSLHRRCWPGNLMARGTSRVVLRVAERCASPCRPCQKRDETKHCPALTKSCQVLPLKLDRLGKARQPNLTHSRVADTPHRLQSPSISANASLRLAALTRGVW